MDAEQRSGNRWEPTGTDTTAPLDTTATGTGSVGTATAEHQPAEPAADPLTGPPSFTGPARAAGAGSWRDRLRLLRTKSAMLAAATLLIGGVGGFALGHAVAGGDEQAGQQGQFTPGQRPDGFGRGDGDGRGFDGDGGPQQGQQGPNQSDTQQGSTSGSTT